LSARLTAEVFGKWAVLTSISATIAAIGDLGLSISAVRAATQKYNEKINYLYDLVTIGRCIGVLVVVCMVVVALLITNNSLGPISVASVAVVVITSGLQSWNNAWYFQAINKIVFYTCLDAMSLIIGLGYCAMWSRNLESALVTNLIFNGLPSVLTTLYLSRIYGMKLPNLCGAREVWKMTKSMALFRTLVAMYTTALPFLFSFSLPVQEIGPLFLAERIYRTGACWLVPVVQVQQHKIFLLLKFNPVSFTRRVRLNLLACVSISLLMISFILVTSSYWINYVSKFNSSLFRYMLFSMSPFLLFISISSILGNLYLIAKAQDREFNKIIFITAITACLMAFALKYFPNPIYFSPYVVVVPEAIGALCMVNLAFRDPVKLFSLRQKDL
jgi:hypothetical protein